MGSSAGSLLGPLDGVFELKNRKIYFNRGFGAAVLELVVEKAGNEFATSLQQRFLVGLIFNSRQGSDGPGKLPEFGESFDDGERGFGGLRAFLAREIIFATNPDIPLAVGCFQIHLPPESILFIDTSFVVDQYKWPSFFG